MGQESTMDAECTSLESWHNIMAIRIHTAAFAHDRRVHRTGYVVHISELVEAKTIGNSETQKHRPEHQHKALRMGSRKGDQPAKSFRAFAQQPQKQNGQKHTVVEYVQQI